ncbi:glutamate synthase large subunit [Methylorubrum extorquens]|uniref:Glutamate synthase [NADPH] large chain n=1 Tax=Methylorubrum extorquens TaxID=408 RepID=A0AAX3WCW4_METEX|nr:glutamate synthase large subunit [Methylorubrum extorquens]WHQ68268.1 glutamate synthase large subunit [Methylorubrum extorquens]
MREIPSELSVSVMNAEKAAPSRAGATPLILRDPGLPAAEGAYNPAHERDACGVGFVADMHDRRSHAIVQQGLKILENIDHRGAVGADPTMGDGCGILTQIPHGFFSEECSRLGFELPPAGQYAIGQFFLPKAEEARASIEAIVEKTLSDEGLPLLGWRDVPVDSADLGKAVKETEPHHRQVFIGCPASVADQDAFERRVYIARKVISNKVYGLEDERVKAFYPVSVSSRTIVYKGMVLVHQLGHYYLDLKDPRFVSALALVHQRFATNTFPTWRLSHPYRMVAHNGEINTLRGNVNWMAARQASVDSELFGNDISKLWPISYEGQSDTACFDNALEFLVAGGYSLAHAMMMLIPEAWAGNPLMSEERRAFYEYHAALMEPWDGPAAVAFTDGRQIGATLDRNGLRPARYIVTDDGLVVLASEMGVLPIPDEKIVQSWRLQPGRMLLIDLEKGRIVSDEEIKGELASAHPYAEWVKNTQIVLEDLHPIQPRASRTDVPLLDRQQAFGYTQEDLKLLMAPMAVTGQEAVGSMGSDTPLSALSDKPKLLYTYFKQNFAQVTNPPIDPIREEAVMSLVSFIGPRPNLLDMEGASRRKRLEVRQPILTNGDLEKIRSISHFEDRFDTRTLDITYAAESGAGAMEGALDRLCDRAEVAVRGGYNIIILSDRMVGPDRIPIPALLATAAVHNYLIRKGLRTSVGLVVESGEPREVHHFACLAGYGAEAINPYLAFETLIAMKGEFPPDLTDDEIVYRYIKSIDKGLLKVMSKMGISTYQSYCGAQIFDAIGLNSDFVAKDFFGTATTVEGIGMAEVAQETTLRHQDAFGDAPIYRNALDVGGEYAYRLRGETHTWTPDTVATLQHAVRLGAAERYREYARLVNEQENHLKTLRGLFRVKTAADLGRQPVDISAIEPASEIVKRFATGAMSYGSISKEAHETLAIAMNSFGGRSNSGEGGEEPRRFITGPDGRSRRSAIKQVASGRFGVTTEYLVNADMMQIKVSQGAKPGEGGQLPGHKVDAKIAKVRYATPGVGLISPPPHHDIYSIEDLAQLIFDLKNVNPAADVSVKLVSEVGVGTVAAGVAKARADHITISGFDGGTGAAPLTSIKHAGGPWETGLAETQQTLVMNGLRGRVALQADGGIRTGKDVMIAVLLGADQIGFSTAPLIAAGCIMMRKCHLNTCPVGVATQDPVLRKRFKGTPEHVINYFFFVAEELRELMAAMGFTKLEDLIGRSDLLDKRDAIEHWKARGLDFSKLFHRPNVGPEVAIRHVETQHHPIDTVLDRRLIAGAETAIETGEPVVLTDVIRNSDRAAGAMLSGAVAKRHGHDGLPDDTIVVKLNGTAGQSFGAWLAAGVTLDLTGHGNDYVGKGLSGGKLIIRPSDALKAPPARTIMAGNTVLYGAIAGECYIRGAAGERFAVRNSGAITVVEGMGDHGCEYMTGGVVVSIGVTGRNFAAGMSGGIAYVLDEDGSFRDRCNLSMVDLEPVEEEDDLMRRFHQDGDLETKGRVDILADMSGHDEERLSQLLTNHMKYTGSPKAKQILDEWAAFRTKFVKVMPVEYRRALREMEMARMPVAAE